MTIHWGWIALLLLVAAAITGLYEQGKSQQPAKAGFFSTIAGGFMAFWSSWFRSSPTPVPSPPTDEVAALRAQVAQLMLLLHQSVPAVPVALAPSNPVAPVSSIAATPSAAPAATPPAATPASGDGTTIQTLEQYALAHGFPQYEVPSLLTFAARTTGTNDQVFTAYLTSLNVQAEPAQLDPLSGLTLMRMLSQRATGQNMPGFKEAFGPTWPQYTNAYGAGGQFYKAGRERTEWWQKLVNGGFNLPDDELMAMFPIPAEVL